MVAILIVCLLVGVLTFYQVFTQGFFSALIMAVLSIVSALLAMNYYAILAPKLHDWGLGGFGPRGICLIAIFAILLLTLRLIADRLIPGNMSFALLVDRIGAAVFGLISSMIVVGVLALGFQLLPVSAKLLAFDRCPELNDPTQDRNLFPNVDGFVIGFTKMASNYCFAGKNKFNQYHPDFLRELYCGRLALDPASRREAPAGAITVKNAYLVRNQFPSQINDINTGRELLEDKGAFIVVNLAITTGTGDKPNTGAADVDGVTRFAYGNVRLFGFDASDQRAPGVSSYPLGVLMPGEQAIQTHSLAEGMIMTESTGQVSLLFDWPTKMSQSPPLFLEFKNSARVKIPRLSTLESTQRDVAKSFKAHKTKLYAPLKHVAGGRAPFYTKEIRIIVDPDDQVLMKKLRFPSNEQIAMAQAEGLLSGSPEEVKVIGGQTYHAHFTYSPPDDLDSIVMNTYPRLHVPDGYALVALTIRGRGRGQRMPNVLPYLWDTRGRLYPYVGYVITGNDYTELAYSVYDDQKNIYALSRPIAKAFPGKMLNRDKAFRYMAILYLIPREQQPIGIIGARRAQQGYQWRLGDDVDLVFVHALR